MRMHIMFTDKVCLLYINRRDTVRYSILDATHCLWLFLFLFVLAVLIVLHGSYVTSVLLVT